MSNSLVSNKITDAEVANVQVEGRDRVLRGTVSQNQAVFDAFCKLIKDKFNAALDVIDGEYVVDIDDEAIEAYTDIGWTQEG
jgi:hypothetical protein